MFIQINHHQSTFNTIIKNHHTTLLNPIIEGFISNNRRPISQHRKRNEYPKTKPDEPCHIHGHIPHNTLDMPQ